MIESLAVSSESTSWMGHGACVGDSELFFAPFAALFISLAQYLLTRRRDIAFGPYLCLAALFLMLNWGSVWEPQARNIFSLGWWVPAMIVVCLALMWAMLTILAFCKERWRGVSRVGA